MKRIALLLLVCTTIPALFAQETSATMPSGSTITLNNSLPETVRDVFTVETLAERFDDDYPFSIWAMVGLQDASTIMLIAKVLQYDPALDTGLNRLYINFNQRASYSYLCVRGPDTLMGKLSGWFQTQMRELDRTYQSSPYFTNAPVFMVAYEKGPDERLIFSGAYSGRALNVQQPIIAQIPGYQQAQIYASTQVGSRSAVLSKIQSGWYPLDLPIDSVTEQRRTSWLIYSFLEVEPE